MISNKLSKQNSSSTRSQVCYFVVVVMFVIVEESDPNVMYDSSDIYNPANPWLARLRGHEAIMLQVSTTYSHNKLFYLYFEIGPVSL